MRRAFLAIVLSAALAAVTAAAAVRAFQSPAGLTVHEWGTFTSVAGPNGQAVNWQPLSGPQDLPCFVEREVARENLTSIQVKGRDIYGLLRILQNGSAPPVASSTAPASLPASPPSVFTAKVRMETPVLYFYTPEAVDVRVNVAFQQGLMSEWYPRAMVPQVNLRQPLTTTAGTIEWPVVSVLPDATPEFPHDAVKSHYYAARDVDAAPVRVGGQVEKFLFYRGAADFQPSITAIVGANGSVTARASSIAPQVVLFENRGGRIGYRIARWSGAPVTLARPALNGTVEALRRELTAMLTSEGLYPREAAAMVETWRDSWFEEGTRIFYLMSRPAVDARLPLTITPAPASVARVFVGRLELITPEMKDDVERAMVTNDLDALNKYGRFLDSIALQIADRPSISANPARLAAAIGAVAASYPRLAACR